MPELEGLQRAQELAQRHLDETIQPSSPYRLVLTAGQEYPTCWMFGYNTDDYMTTGEITHALAGNGPIIVNRRTGVVRVGMSGMPMEDQVDQN